MINQLYNITNTYFPTATTLSLITKLASGDTSDLYPYIITFFILWFASTNLFSFAVQLIVYVLKKVIMYVVCLLLKVLILPVQVLKSCCIKPKLCSLCRDSCCGTQQLKTVCCKKHYHERCFIQCLTKQQLVCPGCKSQLNEKHLLYNMKAGLEIIQNKLS